MAGILLFVAAAAKAEEGLIYPIGEITIEAKQLAAGVGYSWGDGVMKFQGKEYPFTVQGLNVAAVGFSKIHAVGDVYNLKTAAYPTRLLALRPKPSRPQRPLPRSRSVDGSGTAGAEPIWARPSENTMLPLWSFR
jgi:hypothetical protein